MLKEEFENINTKIQNYSSLKYNTAQLVIADLKKDCTTYLGLENKLKEFERNFRYLDPSNDRCEELFEIIRGNIEREKSSLPLANHF